MGRTGGEAIGMENTRGQTAWKLLRGTAAAALATLPGMLLLAAAVVLMPVPDAALTIANQLLKVACVFIGVRAAVGAGGERGAVTGAAVGTLYMLAGYGLYCALAGARGMGVLAAELLFGAVLGAIAGAITANLRPRRPKVRQRAT